MQNRYCQLSNGLVAAFTLLQLVALFVFGYTPYPDSNGYILLAEECVARHDWYPIASELHGYPFLWNIGAINAVAASLKLFGSVVPLLILYSLMKGATAWLLYGITKSISTERTALIALILYMAYPANYGESTSALSELPFMFFTMLGIYLYMVRNMSLPAGMMLAVANWFRPMAIVFLLALIASRLTNWRKNIRLLAGYAAAILIIGSTTMLRTGLFLYQAQTGWMALMDYSSGNAPESMAVRDNTEWDVSQKDAAWQSLFISWLKEHPGEYIGQMPAKLINTYVSDNVNMCTFLTGKESREYMYDEVSMPTLLHAFPRYTFAQWLALLNLAVYYALLLLALLGLRHFHRNTHLLPVAVIASGTLLLLFVGHGEARFHIPFMPFIIMLAAISIKKV